VKGRFPLHFADATHPPNSGNISDFQPARYSADITAGSLKPTESRLVAALLLKGLGGAALDDCVVTENTLRSSQRSTAIRIVRLLRKRLEPMGPRLWELVERGSGTVCTHALMAAAIHHSRLLADFLDLVVREQHRAFATTLPKRLWDEFLVDCRGRDAGVETWSDSTCRKCGTVVYHMLAQAGYIDNCRSLKLQRVHVAAEVTDYLRSQGHGSVLRCMQVNP
jgi:hypothetical protein